MSSFARLNDSMIAPMGWKERALKSSSPCSIMMSVSERLVSLAIPYMLLYHKESYHFILGGKLTERE